MPTPEHAARERAAVVGASHVTRNRTSALAGTAILVLIAATPLRGQEPSVFDEGFDAGWEARWDTRALDSRETEFAVVDEIGPVLEAHSRNAAAGIGRRLDAAIGDGLVLSWRWRIEGGLPVNRREREEAGDDYAGRLLVAFDGELFDSDTRVISYVWSSTEPVGSRYLNPYRENVITIVSRRGAGSGGWSTHERDLGADFRRVFREEPGRVTGIAIVVDTDDTGSEVTTRVDDVSLTRPDR